MTPVRARQLGARHPELGAAVVVVAAWAILVGLAIRPEHGMAGMDMPVAAATGGVGSALGALAAWVVMAIAMMGPAALAGVRHTGLNSFVWRRRQAMAEFAAAYLAVWAAFGAVALGLAAVLPGTPGPVALAAVLAGAALWQLTPAKQLALRRCHRGVPLPPRGWRADRGALAFGLRNGWACVGSCWCLMLVMVAAPGAHLLWTVAIGGLVSAERLLARPRRMTRRAAPVLGVAALMTATAALVF